MNSINNINISQANKLPELPTKRKILPFIGRKNKYEYLDEFVIQGQRTSKFKTYLAGFVLESLTSLIDFLERRIQIKTANNPDLKPKYKHFYTCADKEQVENIINQMKEAKRLGYKGVFAYNAPKKAKEVNETVNLLKEAGYQIPKIVRVLTPKASELSPTAAGFYSICSPNKINLTSGIIFSNPVEETVTHEIAHMLHRLRDKKLYDYLGINDVKLKPELQEKAVEEINEFTSSNAKEFVADAFHKLVNGGTLSEELMKAYEALKGPVIKGILRK